MAPRIRPFESTIWMFLAALFRRLTGPVKLLPELVSVIAAPPVSKVAAPAPAAWTIGPVWVIAPVVVIANVPVPRLTVPRIVVPESLISTEAVPLAETLIVLPKTFDSVSRMSALATDVVNDAVPLGTESTLPACCVIAPDAEITRFLPAASVRLGRSRAPVWVIEIGPFATVSVPKVVTLVAIERPVGAVASSVPPVVIRPVPEMPCCEVSVIVPVPVVTGPSMPIPPPPVWSKVIGDASDVVSDVTETAVPEVLLMSIAPAVVSAETKKAARFTAPVVPIPVVAFRSTVLAVIRLLPSMSPPCAVSVTVLPVAVIGLTRAICCCEMSVTSPVATIAFGTAMPYTLATVMSPAADVIVEKPSARLPLTLIPVLATSEP